MICLWNSPGCLERIDYHLRKAFALGWICLSFACRAKLACPPNFRCTRADTLALPLQIIPRQWYRNRPFAMPVAVARNRKLFAMDEKPEPRTRIRTTVVFLMFFAVLGAVVVFAYFATFSRPITTVILVRHAEKNIEPNNPDPDLSPAGQARAQELARMFSEAGVNVIYATQYKRTQETVKPLADRLGLSVNQINSKQSADLVRRILTAHRGQTVFVAGHNNTVPEIVAALGGGDFPAIPENEYDNMFIVTVYRFSRAKVVKLRYGTTSPTGAGSGGTMVP